MDNYDNRRFQFAPPVTQNLMIINLLFWLAQTVLEGRFGIDLTDMLGLHYLQAGKFNVAQLLPIALHALRAFVL